MSDQIKRSVTIAGHRTSISLEPPFWDALKELACRRKLSVNELVRKIDATRTEGANLSSAVRVFILYEVQKRAADSTAPDPSDAEE